MKILKLFKLNDSVDDLKERMITYEFSHVINFPVLREKL